MSLEIVSTICDTLITIAMIWGLSRVLIKLF